MNALLIVGPLVYGVIVLAVVTLCKAAAKPAPPMEGWRNTHA